MRTKMGSEEYERGHAAGASEARKKLAKYLSKRGIIVSYSRGSVPDDNDFYNAIVAYLKIQKSTDEGTVDIFIDDYLIPDTGRNYEDIDLDESDL
jgi:hypothetical protein